MFVFIDSEQKFGLPDVFYRYFGYLLALHEKFANRVELKKFNTPSGAPADFASS